MGPLAEIEFHSAPAAHSDPPRPASPKDITFDVELVRRRGIIGILIAAWAVTASLFAICLVREPSIMWSVAISIALNMVSTLQLLRENFGAATRLSSVIVAAFQPLLIYYVMQESGMPPQAPLGYVVAVVAVGFLCDTRALALATGLCCLQLAVLALFFPDWVFYSEGVVWRSLLHIIGIAVIGIVGAIIIATMSRLVIAIQREKARTEKQVKLLAQQTDELELALSHVETERRERERVESDQAAARKAELGRIAGDFENSISVVTQSIARTADLLGSTTKELNVIAQDTGQSASDVCSSAEAASNAARNVARGVAELSSSIANIAVNVSQQNDLTSSATERSSFGGEAVGGLTKHSATIEEATRAIVRIAERTNLLSLNAAIEAASAGPAGRGFTIVAQEVKGLAMQASEAATEINEFLSGVRSGTLEAQHSFDAIDSAISELADAATAIRWDVEKQRKSADTIEDFARTAADDVGAMAARSRSLATTASTTQKLSGELDEAAAEMVTNVRKLEESTAQFMRSLQAG